MTDLLRTADRCQICFQPCPPNGTRWTLLSRHSTSEGDVQYRASSCGCRVIVLGEEILKAIPASPAA